MVFAYAGRSQLRFGGDGNLNAGAFFEADVVTIFVKQCVFDAKLAESAFGPIHSNLGFFRLARVRRWDDFGDGTGQRHARVIYDSRGVVLAFSNSCGTGHARLCQLLQFLRYGDASHAAGCLLVLLIFVMNHAFIVASE